MSYDKQRFNTKILRHEIRVNVDVKFLFQILFSVSNSFEVFITGQERVNFKWGDKS